jgi:ABC-type multidrug transport system ATPase subunit
MISTRRLSIVNRDTSVLHDISIRVAAGECVGIRGDAASGKTTLLRALAGVIRPTGGTIHLDGDERPADGSRLRRNVGYAAAEAIVGDGLRVDEYLRFVARMKSPPSTVATSTPSDAARLVGLPPSAPIAQLVPEGRAALAIAAALVVPGNVLIIDGVVDVLPPPERTRVVSKLIEIRDRGGALLLVTEDPDVERALCRRVLTLVNGGVADEVNLAAPPAPVSRSAAEVRPL